MSLGNDSTALATSPLRSWGQFIQFSLGYSFIEPYPGDSCIGAQPKNVFRKPWLGAGGDLCSVEINAGWYESFIVQIQR